MSRPSRQEEAKVEIDRFYAVHGVMPTIEALTTAMGYHSTSSTHNTVMGLVKQGFLLQEERGGRLLPGPSFVRDAKPPSQPRVPGIPAPVLEGLPADVSLSVLRVEDDSLSAHAIRIGDMLVLAPLERTDLSDLILQRRGAGLAIRAHFKSGWKSLGVLVAQFRNYS